ncbi:MAG: hypothetical protein ACOYN6_12075 [Ignavibacteria bacterium]
MIRFIYINIVISFLFIYQGFLPAQSKSDFANHLFNNGDYYRAISEYKELSFFSKNNDSVFNYEMQIARSYRLSKKYETSVFYFSNILNKNASIKTGELDICYFNIGLNYLGLKIPSQTIQYSSLLSNNSIDKKHLLNGYFYLKTNQYDSSLKYFKLSEIQSKDSSIRMISSQYRNNIIEYLKAPQKSTFLATALSIIVPGMGQVYTKHYVDGLQAFGFVAVFGFTTYATYKYDQKYSANYLLTIISAAITSSFYVANIISANTTAQYYNQRVKDKYFYDLDNNLMNTNF